MLYLVRHGEAVAETADPNRPLSERGRQEVTRVAQLAGRLGLKVGLVVHSDKLRARQTAEIFAGAFEPTPRIETRDDLQPAADPPSAAQYINTARESLMVVGHLPHLSRLISQLILGDPERELITFSAGAIAALEQAEGRWRIQWILTPGIGKAAAALTAGHRR